MKTNEKIDDIFIKNLPTIDLHGDDREIARVKTNDFVDEAFFMGWSQIVIIHGIGSGIVKRTVHDTLERNNKVIRYHVYGTNIGCTIVYINNRKVSC